VLARVKLMRQFEMVKDAEDGLNDLHARRVVNEAMLADGDWAIAALRAADDAA
jgi:hypothetical protein